MEQQIGTLGFAIETSRGSDRYEVRENPMGERAKKAHRWMVWDKAAGRAVKFAATEKAAQKQAEVIVWKNS